MSVAERLAASFAAQAATALPVGAAMSKRARAELPRHVVRTRGAHGWTARYSCLDPQAARQRAAQLEAAGHDVHVTTITPRSHR